ncbi:hypothetical protein OG884_06190 [Streptosporangium sp. NBC_01755]|uniref:hypothetical protein n=1 Tax=Streptosporangium sp. NBC_01755 TaxID=2975949 RepID=UPI002DDAA633|nr:hypothetical protein [Streptosporangium sp. NBC_01755]WSD01517.1 hypothetical protein OG884_06190 [Streptosporangium sp. NBC_01755]
MKALVLAAALVAAASCSTSPGEVVSRVGPPNETSSQVYTLHVRTGPDGKSEAVAVTPGEYEACPVGSLYPACAEGAR